MGYIVLGAQLETIVKLTGGLRIESIELLHLPAGLKLTIWREPSGPYPQIYYIDRDGNYATQREISERSEKARRKYFKAR